MADIRLYLCYSVLLIFLGCAVDFGIQSGCDLTNHKEDKCFKQHIDYTIDLKCMSGSLIHVIKETYLNSSLSDTCIPDNKCNGQIVKNHTNTSYRPSDYRLQTACNAKSECTETLEPSYFNCVGIPLGRVDYECVPESVNYNICDNLTVSDNLTTARKNQESVIFLTSPKSGTSDPILCNCEIRGENMRVQIVDFSANTSEKRWFLNITSDSLLNYYYNYSTTVAKRLLNNVVEGFHETIQIKYYHQDTSNQNIWIELIGKGDVEMKLNCSSWVHYSTTRNASHTPQTAIQVTTLKPSSTHSTNINDTSTVNYNTTFTTAVANTTTPKVITASEAPTSSAPTPVEIIISTEVTTNASTNDVSGHSTSREKDWQTLTISVVVVAIALVVATVVVAVCIVYRRRRNNLKSIDHVTPKTNNNPDSSPNISEQHDKSNNDYTEIDLGDLQPEVTNGSVLSSRHSLNPSTCSNLYWTVDPHDLDENENTNNDNVREKSKRNNGAVNICYSKDDVNQLPNRDQTKKNVQVVVIANDFLASKPDNTPQKSNRPPIKPRKSRAAFSNKEAENEGSGDISSELGENPVSQINSSDNHHTENKLKDKHVTTPESGSKCVPEEEMKDNFLYDMDDDDDDDDTQFEDSLKCFPEEDIKDNFLYSMDDTEV